MISTIKQFIMMCIARPGNEADLFEDSCTEEVRSQIYALADPESPEPFRSAMIALGFTDY